MGGNFTILAVVQGGRLEAEALLFMASLRASGNGQRVVLAEPQPGPLWDIDPRIGGDFRAALTGFGAEIRPLHSRHFGSAYPHGNKIEALTLLDDGPFVFFDTDTLFLGPLSRVPFDFARPAASMRREGTWPKALPGWPGHAAVWGSLYRKFGLDLAGSLDVSRADDDWQRYLYFNAGWFAGASPVDFGRKFLDFALEVRRDPPPELAGQKLEPWLDQIVLPLVIHALGGGRPLATGGLLDGSVTCHYRTLPLLHARESAAAQAMFERVAAMPWVAGLLDRYPPWLAFRQGGLGPKIRALFPDPAGKDEAFFRKNLKAAGLWLR